MTLSNIRHLVFDMDGTIYRGKTLFSYTLEAFRILEACGISWTYLTNNSSVSAADYVQKIHRLGLPGDKENLYTSSLATLDFLRKEYPTLSMVYLLGTDSLKKEFAEAGYRVLSGEDSSEPEIVVVAFDTALTYAALCKTAWWIKQGKPYFATHPDAVCPTDLPTVLVDCGSICDCIASATGRTPDRVFGKPDRSMIDGIMHKHGLQPHETGMVGDRLYTDMEMARRAGVIGILVLSGEATRDDLEKSGLSPECVFENILELANAVQKT
ncbi:MAG: HAD-IIA family hydrolase [Planctomycetaceae bacterium]|jgi:NagD protein|nr:HAD-IIA family hydrolase [Planctomycetaceae bacterium]